MEICIGKTSGFCFGVQRAVDGAEKLVNEVGSCYCLGELIHNSQVVGALEEKGMKTIESLEEATDPSCKVMFRAHGVAKEIYKDAEKRGISYEDYTCPKVIHLHNLAERYANEGYFVILLGKKSHPENIGTISFCNPLGRYVLEEPEDTSNALDAFQKSGMEQLAVLSQTTYSLAKFNKIREEVLKLVPYAKIEETICASTRLRQEETKELASEMDKMIIIGGKNSSNTKKLEEVAVSVCKKVFLVETYQELNKEDFEKEDKVGIMAGASTPKKSVDEVVAFLEKE